MVSSFAAIPAAAQAKPVPGKLAGVVRDAAGTPQMGASVELVSEAVGMAANRGLLTNTQGVFRGDKLAPGFYTVRVTLAGFLPTFEKHIQVTSNLTTVVRIELESMFATLDQLRRMPASSTAEVDDWKWVLRSASAMRPVLEWVDSDTLSATALAGETSGPRIPKMRMEFTDGARRSGSASSIAASPATAVAYDQKLGGTSRMIFAGQVSYDTDTPAGGIATVWLPTGTLGAGPHTALVLREARLGPVGPTFRGVRIDQGGALGAALNELDAFPALLWRRGHPVLQNGIHEEISAERKIGTRGKLQIAGFHDDNSHVAVFGRGTELPNADYFQDGLSTGFAYDGGSSSSWGTRVAFREKLNGDLELTAVYSFGGALAPSDVTDDLLRDVLHTAQRHSIAAGISAKVPRLGTKVQAGYKWVNGVAVSSVDSYGESLFQTDPYFHLIVRQPLPKFALGRWEAIADCNNLLAQGYVPTNSRDGRVMLVPAFRTFRGGLSVQF